MAAKSDKTSITVYVAILIAAICSTGILILVLQFLNLRELDRRFNSLNDQLESRTDLFVSIQRSLGYDGIIHNLKDYVIRRDSRYLETAQERVDYALGLLEEYRALPGVSDEEISRIDFVGNMVGKYDQITRYFASIDTSPMNTRELNALTQVDHTMALSSLENLTRDYELFADRGREEVMQVIRLSIIGLLVPALVSGFFLVFLFLLIGRRLRNRIRRIHQATLRIGHGDLRNSIALESRDFLGSIAGNFDTAIEHFRDAVLSIHATLAESRYTAGDLTLQIENILNATNRINSEIRKLQLATQRLSSNAAESTTATEEITATIRNLARGIDSQVSAVTQTSASIEEMAASIRNVASVTEARMESSRDLERLTEEGEAELASTDGYISEISESIDDMLEMIDVIEHVADQTDMLSMNAAIEAAHAGETGKGFAVVAEEIRKLAESTRENSSQVSGRLKNTISTIHSALKSSRSSREAFVALRSSISGMLDSFTEISNSTQELSAGSRQILSAVDSLMSVSGEIKLGSEEILGGSEEIGVSLNSMHQIVETVGKEVYEVLHSAGDISDAAAHISEAGIDNNRGLRRLGTRVSFFKLEDDESASQEIDFSTYILQHHRWVSRVGSALAGNQTIKLSEMTDHHSCDVGKWIDSEGESLFRGNPVFPELKRSHEQVHRLLMEIVRNLNDGKTEEAGEAFSTLLETSNRLVSNFAKLKESLESR
jgi:methyl-accepting chemotaxis protein